MTYDQIYYRNQSYLQWLVNNKVSRVNLDEIKFLLMHMKYNNDKFKKPSIKIQRWIKNIIIKRKAKIILDMIKENKKLKTENKKLNDELRQQKNKIFDVNNSQNKINDIDNTKNKIIHDHTTNKICDTNIHKTLFNLQHENNDMKYKIKEQQIIISNQNNLIEIFKTDNKIDQDISNLYVVSNGKTYGNVVKWSKNKMKNYLKNNNIEIGNKSIHHYKQIINQLNNRKFERLIDRIIENKKLVAI